MNMIDAFMWMTGLTYLCAIILPKKFEHKMGFITQKIVFAVLGSLWILSVSAPFPPFDNPLRWPILGLGYIAGVLMNYTGMMHWGSEFRDVFMIGWDLLLAWFAFSKF